VLDLRDALFFCLVESIALLSIVWLVASVYFMLMVTRIVIVILTLSTRRERAGAARLVGRIRLIAPGGQRAYTR